MDVENLVVGAGVFGLTIARALRRRGRQVLVVERDRVGAGASATPLGVLAPHSPDRWNEKKAQQFQALSTMPDYIADLEAETGLSVGYRRAGRLIPLPSEAYRAIWENRCEDARLNWQGRAEIAIVEPDVGWLSPESAPFGAALCGLSARLDARAYLVALAASVGTIRCGYDLDRFEEGTAYFANGERIAARKIVVATGVDAFQFLPEPDAGRGEKGQAAILRLPVALADELPLIYSNRLYVVPRGGDLVAVGATSERDYESATAPDAQLDALIERAAALCPALRDAEVVERWANLRPRAADRKPLMRQVSEPVIVATGGFKTGLAVAHIIAETVAGITAP